jgi:hypothetical protein
MGKKITPALSKRFFYDTDCQLALKLKKKCNFNLFSLVKLHLFEISSDINNT